MTQDPEGQSKEILDTKRGPDLVKEADNVMSRESRMVDGGTPSLISAGKRRQPIAAISDDPDSPAKKAKKTPAKDATAEAAIAQTTHLSTEKGADR